jgi:hypothetical protein
MTFWNWYVFFRQWKFGPVASLIKAANMVHRRHHPERREKSVSLSPRWYEKTWFESLVVTYPGAYYIAWLLLP